MTPEQFDALEKMIKSIVRAEMTPTHLNCEWQREDTEAARALLVEQPAKEISASPSGCVYCDKGLSITTTWGGNKHAIKQNGRLVDCTRDK